MHSVRDAFRSLRTSPGVSAVAILSLALGIGANTAIFSLLNSLFIKPLPIRDPQRLIALGSDQPGEDASVTFPTWQQVRDRHLLNDAFVWALMLRIIGAAGWLPARRAARIDPAAVLRQG